MMKKTNFSSNKFKKLRSREIIFIEKNIYKNIIILTLLAICKLLLNLTLNLPRNPKKTLL